MEFEVKSLSPIQLFATLWTVEKESWGGLPFPFPGDLPHPGIKPGFPSLQADALLSEPPGKPICR